MKCSSSKKISFYLFIVLAFVKSNAQQPEVPMSDNISYSSTMDAENIYVHLSTVDRSTMHTMLQRGLYVYFDVRGKKKKKVAIQYPINISPPQRPNRNDRDTGGNRAEVVEEKEHGPDISVLVAEMPKMALYTNLDSELEFHLDLNKLGVSIKYDYDTEGKILRYELTIPKHRIADGESNFSKLSIGIISPKIEEEIKEKSSNVGFNGGGQGGGRGGQGGRPGGGQGRGGSQTDRSQQGERPEETAIDFWFKANFAK